MTMKSTKSTVDDDAVKSQDSIVQREHQERLAKDRATSEILSKLNISIEILPEEQKKLLREICTRQTELGVKQLDPLSISLLQSADTSEVLQHEYKMLKIRHRLKMLEAQISFNTKFINQLKEDIVKTREVISQVESNTDNISEMCRQMTQKVVAYQESWEKAQAKFFKLGVPEQAMPALLVELVKTQAELSAQADAARRDAQDVVLVRQARDAFQKLRRKE